jgi:hypothetical protein
MKRKRLSIIIFLILFFSVSGYPQSKQINVVKNSKISSKLLHNIQTILPKNWAIEIQEEKLDIKRKDPISAVILLPSMSFDAVSQYAQTPYYFTLELTDFISPDEFLRIRNNNQRLQEEGDLLYREKIIHIPSERDKAPPWEWKYYPRTAKETQLVEKYKNIYSQIKLLPDYYYNNQSFYFYQPLYKFENLNEENECKGITEKILGLLNKY